MKDKTFIFDDPNFEQKFLKWLNSKTADELVKNMKKYINKEDRCMYFITTLQIKNNDIEDSRCVGYFSSFEKAEQIVKNNTYDLEETIYNYIVIENIPEGIYQYDQNAKWYKFNRNTEKYDPCDKPKEMNHLVGFGIG